MKGLAIVVIAAEFFACFGSSVDWKVNAKFVPHLLGCGSDGAGQAAKMIARRQRLSTPVAVRANQCWGMDFVSDKLSDGRVFRVLTSLYKRLFQGRDQIFAGHSPRPTPTDSHRTWPPPQSKTPLPVCNANAKVRAT